VIVRVVVAVVDVLVLVDGEVVVGDVEYADDGADAAFVIAEWARKAARKLERKGRLVVMVFGG
jgi:hypothetical protein